MHCHKLMRTAGGIARGKPEVPLTVSVTSRSPAPTRGTTARHTYFPASSWRTDLSVSLFSLLRTWKRGGGCFQGERWEAEQEMWVTSSRAAQGKQG